MNTDEKIEKEAVDLMKFVYKRGFNIYMLLNKVKKQLKRVDNFPPEVIISVCKEFITYKDRSKIRNDYTWFVRVMVAKSHEYQAQQNINEHKTHKNAPPMAQNVRDILKGML